MIGGLKAAYDNKKDESSLSELVSFNFFNFYIFQ